MKWISIKERLPENEQQVLCFDRDKDRLLCVYLDYEFFWIDKAPCGGKVEPAPHSREKYITHWMPLPDFRPDED